MGNDEEETDKQRSESNLCQGVTELEKGCLALSSERPDEDDPPWTTGSLADEGYYRQSWTNESLYALNPNKAQFKQQEAPRRTEIKRLSGPAFPAQAYVR